MFKKPATANLGYHFLFPSGVFVTSDAHEIHTLLGSCVAVCIYDQKRRIGGMNHYMVPFWNGTGLASPKYGNIAIEMLLEKLIQQGSRQTDLVAKIFGGSNQFEEMNQTIAVGNRNIMVAEDLLKRNNIPLIAKSVGGSSGRRIVFNTESGVVGVRFIK